MPSRSMNGLGVRHPVGEAKFLENAVNHLSRRIREVSPETPRAGETVSVGDDFVQYLTELGIGHTWHQPVARHSPDRAAAITVVETGGPAPYHDYGPRRGDRPPLRCSILVRNPAYLLARDKADQIRDAFDGLANWPINGTRYLSVTAMSDPALPRQGRHEPGGDARVQPELRHDARAGSTGHRPVRPPTMTYRGGTLHDW